MAKPNKTLLQFMDECSPALVRIMAIDSGKGLKTRLKTNAELEEASGLHNRMIRRLSNRKTWKDIKVGIASKYIEACGVELVKTQPEHGQGVRPITRGYFFSKYVNRGLVHLTDEHLYRICRIMGWDVDEIRALRNR